MTLFVFLLLLIIPHAFSYDAKDTQTALQTNPASLPTFVTHAPAETRFHDPNQLEQARDQVPQTQGGNFMAHSLKKRPYFKIDTTTDPMITFSQTAHEKQKELLAGKPVTLSVPQFNHIQYCIEGKDQTEVRCTETLVAGVHTGKRTLYKGTYHHGWNNGYWSCWRYDTPSESTRQVYRHFDGCNWWDHHIKQYHDFEIKEHPFNSMTGQFEDRGWQQVDEATYHAFTPAKDEQGDQWVSSCPLLAAKVQQGLCTIKETKCISHVSSKIFTDASGSLTFSRPCFQYEIIYSCKGSSRQECNPLRQKGCVQIGSRCLKKMMNECYEWKQKMHCPGPQKRRVQIKEGTAFTPNKTKLTFPLNTEFNEALSTFALFNEMQKDTGVINPEIFKGTTNRCTKAFAGFKDCCGIQKGWGIQLNLAGCNGEDQALLQKRAKNLCVEVGTFCAEKALGVCLRQKRSFCCFDSKMARIFHEQGRRQLGISFGSPKHPQCRGFTIDELQRIDFSKIDLREIHQELLKNMKVPNAREHTQGLKDRLTAMTQGIKNTPTQGGL